MHTGKPGFKHRQNRPDLRVAYIHMSALLGYVVDIVLTAVLGLEGVETEMKVRICRAFNRVVWVQNDLIARWYSVDEGDGEAVNGAVKV
jgi:hypothetical protein